MRFSLFALLLVTSQLSVAGKIPAAIESCMKQNLPESTSAQSIELRARDRSNFEQVLQADVFWKRFEDDRSRVLMYFHEPADIRGARFLIIEKQPLNDMYIYMPGLFKVRKITSRKISSSIMGTDFSYEDFERLQGILSDTHAEQFPDDVISGNPAYVMMSYPDETSGYVKVATYIDKKSCVPLKTELYERGHRLRKEMSVDPAAIQSKGGIWFPAELVMKDLRDKTETRLLVQNIDVGITLDDELFDPENLKQVDIPAITR
jgi:hypothetical protein